MSPQNIREGDRLVVSLRRTLDRNGMLFSSEGTALKGQNLVHPVYYGGRCISYSRIRGNEFSDAMPQTNPVLSRGPLHLTEQVTDVLSALIQAYCFAQRPQLLEEVQTNRCLHIW
jgi:hypothetical protein